MSSQKDARDLNVVYQYDRTFKSQTYNENLPPEPLQSQYAKMFTRDEPIPEDILNNFENEQNSDTTQYKYNEDKFIAEFAEYVKSTYSQHYAGKNNIQALDLWVALGSLFTSSRDVAIKYLCRLGKKGSKEDFKKDILKVMHYSLFMLFALESEENNK